MKAWHDICAPLSCKKASCVWKISAILFVFGKVKLFCFLCSLCTCTFILFWLLPSFITATFLFANIFWCNLAPFGKINVNNILSYFFVSLGFLVRARKYNDYALLSLTFSNWLLIFAIYIVTKKLQSMMSSIKVKTLWNWIEMQNSFKVT